VAGLGGSAATGGTTSGGTSSGGSTTTGVSVQTRTGASVAVSYSQRIRTALRKGIRVRCKAPASGRCVARLRAKRKTIAIGSARVKAGHTVTFTVRFTRAGRKLMRRSRRLSARIEIAVPGSGKIVRTLRFRR
jgi:hypothetical protein